MKYILTILAGVVLFGGTASANNLTTCGNNYHNEMVIDPITLVVTNTQIFDGFLGCDGSDPMKVTQAWGVDGYHTPVVKAGTVTVDAWNYKNLCPVWYGLGGCFDISNTSYYKDLMTKAFGAR